MYSNPIWSPYLEIHPELMGTGEYGEERHDNDGHSHYSGEDFSDSDLDEISKDIDDKGEEEAEDVSPFDR